MFTSVHRYGVCVPSRVSRSHVRAVKQVVRLPVSIIFSSRLAGQPFFYQSDDVLLCLLVALLAYSLRGNRAFVDRKLALNEKLFLLLVQLILSVLITVRFMLLLIELLVQSRRVLCTGTSGRIRDQL